MYRNALKRDMRFGEAYYRSALAELKLGRLGEAARDLQRAVELQPENLDAHTQTDESVPERVSRGQETWKALLVPN